MNAKQCRQESDKVQNAWGMTREEDHPLRNDIITLANSRALWEIAGQLADYNAQQANLHSPVPLLHRAHMPTISKAIVALRMGAEYKGDALEVASALEEYFHMLNNALAD